MSVGFMALASLEIVTASGTASKSSTILFTFAVVQCRLITN